MPGIVGLITQMPRQWAEPQLLRMVRAICHEPFYITGTWIDEDTGVYVGWAARKDSFSEGMPLSTEDNNVCLIFSGEEFPDPQTVRHLKQRGHGFVAEGSSYLVHLYEEDPSFPKNLNGRFQWLLTDKARGTVMLFNDRYGMHQVCYHESKEAFYFAAEAKAILAVRPELRTVDPRGLGEFVASGCVLENRTLFPGIQVLPPASQWMFGNGALSKKSKYFDPSEWENQGALEPEAYYQQLRDVFSTNLPRYFGGREPVALSLTGGLDSRMIMAWWKAQPNSLPCYTFGGTYRDCQDVVIARRVAKIWQQPYQVIPVGDQFLSRFANYAERTVYLAEGRAPVYRAADLYANEIAATIAPVRMTGNYGGEILRRLRMFKPEAPPAGLFRPELLAQVDEAKQTYARWFHGHAVSFTAFRQAPWYHSGLLALDQTQLTMRTPYLDNDLVQTAFRAPNSAIMKADVFENSVECSRLIADGNRTLARVRTDRRPSDSQGSLLTPITSAYLEFTFRAEYAYDYGMPQWVARVDHSLAPLRLERLFLGRHKFSHYRVWYRDTLSSYVREMLLDPRTLSRPYLETKGVEAIVNGHLKGDRNYTSEIHRLLTLELLHRLFVDA
jgi:asparagine synthase (glutamine-hydrolysing)